jgi:hypothetical protein
MAYYVDFIQLQRISVTFGAFKILPQHFKMVWNFKILDLAMAKVEKVIIADV